MNASRRSLLPVSLLPILALGACSSVLVNPRVAVAPELAFELELFDFFVDPWVDDDGTLVGVTERGLTTAGVSETPLSEGLDPDPEQDLALLDAIAVDGGSELLVAVGDEVGVLEPGATELAPLEAPAGWLTARYAGGDIVFLVDDDVGCALIAMDPATEAVELPDMACELAAMESDDGTGRVWVAVGPDVLEIVGSTVRIIDQPAVDLSWDSINGHLWTLSDEGTLTARLAAASGAPVFFEQEIGIEVRAVAAFGGGVAVLRGGDTSQILSTFDGEDFQRVDISLIGSFDTLAGAAGSPVLAATGDPERSLTFRYLPSFR